MAFRLIISLLAFAAVSFPSLAQTQEPANSSPDAVQPAVATTKTADAPSTDQKKAKKVWTNEEISQVGGTISVVGKPLTGSPASKTASGSNPTRQRQITSYRNEVQRYQTQIDSIDRQIREFKNFKGDNSTPSGGIDMSHRYTMLAPEEQVKELEQKKKELQTKIEDVEAQALKDGIEPGDLR